jgi:FtsH-binding integral membrane protein
MGYEYGFDYPGFPLVGMLLFLLFTISAGILLGWVTLRGRSVWPAVIGHSAINGIAALALLFTQGEPPSLLGPLPVGLIGMIGYLVLGAVLYFLPAALVPKEPSSLPYPHSEG